MKVVTKPAPEPHERICTPLADRLIELRKLAGKSFHALPLSAGASISRCKWREKYEAIYGENYLASELTVTGRHFDSLFFSEGIIKEAEELTARLFGADQTLFVTTGTTTSNQIALSALYRDGMRVLMDKNCHQSLHFTLHTLGAKVDHLEPRCACESTSRSVFDLEEMLAKLLQAQKSGNGFDLIVLNAHSYDGVVYDIPGIINYLLEQGVTTRRFFIDEAWGATNYFHDQLRHHCAMNISALRLRYPDLAVVSTHSAHKSMSCLRQASMIHFRGPREFGERLRIQRFRLHTTSPSYPILASLDLARAQMQDVGRQLLRDTTALAAEFIDTIANDPGLSCYRINSFSFPSEPFGYAIGDPTKVSLDVSDLSLSAHDVRDLLYSKYGIYINRLTESSLLLNFHIGIDRTTVEDLLTALRDLKGNLVPSWISHASSDAFIIPYPPGVPLVLPGEEITTQLRSKIRDIQRAGARIFLAWIHPLKVHRSDSSGKNQGHRQPNPVSARRHRRTKHHAVAGSGDPDRRAR